MSSDDVDGALSSEILVYLTSLQKEFFEIFFRNIGVRFEVDEETFFSSSRRSP